MTWVRFSDDLVDQPEVMGLSDSAFRLWVRGRSYGARVLSDGAIPASFTRGWDAEAGELLTAKLWTSIPTGYLDVLFADTQDDRETTLLKRAEMRDAKVRAGIARATNAPRVGGRFTSTSPAGDSAAGSSAGDPAGSSAGDDDQHATSPSPSPYSVFRDSESPLPLSRARAWMSQRGLQVKTGHARMLTELVTSHGDERVVETLQALPAQPDARAYVLAAANLLNRPVVGPTNGAKGMRHASDLARATESV